VVHGIFGHVGLPNKTYEPEQEYRRSADRMIDTKIDPASPIPLEKKKNMQNQRRRASVGSNREGMANGRLCACRPTLALRSPLGGHSHERPAVPLQARRVAREGLPAQNRHINVARVDLDGLAGPAGDLGRDDRSSNVFMASSAYLLPSPQCHFW
jgi:hypothetical protein